jgi:hypothetical protein
MLAKHRRTIDPSQQIPEIAPTGGTGSLDAALAVPVSAVRRFLKVLGPGLITGASDDDPSGIGTYAIAGASFGFNTLWVALITLPMMSSVQSVVPDRSYQWVPRTPYAGFDYAGFQQPRNHG